MQQVDTKTALMQCEEFRKAYTKLKELVREGEYWFIDSLEYYIDIVSVIFHPEYRVKYGELWLVFAEIKYPDSFHNAERYGFTIVDEVTE